MTSALRGRVADQRKGDYVNLVLTGGSKFPKFKQTSYNHGPLGDGTK